MNALFMTLRFMKSLFIKPLFMKPLLRMLRHYLFWQPIMRGLFAFGVLFWVLGLAVWLAADEHQGGAVIAGLGAGLMLAFPVLLAGTAFRQLLGNGRLLLVPHFRFHALLALPLLCALAGAALWFSLTLADNPARIYIVSYVFVAMTGWILVAQWLTSKKYGPFVLWLVFLIPAQLLKLVPNKQLLVTPYVASIALLLAMTAWWLAWRWLRRQRALAPLAHTASLSSAQRNQHTLPLNWLRGQPVSAAGTLLTGAADNLRNRMKLHAALFFGFPLGFALVQALMSLDLSFLTAVRDKPQTTLMMAGYGIFMTMMISREWPARMRLLWLHTGGDRPSLYRVLERLLHKELAIGIAALSVLITALLAFTTLSATLALAAWLTFTTILIWLHYGTLWLRLIGGGWFSQLVQMLITLLAGAAALGHHFATGQWSVLLTMMAMLSAITLLLRWDCRRRFRRVDWCQLRPQRLALGVERRFARSNA